MSEDDARFMRRAIDLARTNLGKTGDNPSVGCVLVKDGQVLAEAATAAGGRPHAEEQALVMAEENATGAVAYVTLEPCGERSSGALSCADRLIFAGVAKVVIACDDPSPFASGRGADALSEADVAVESGLLADEAAPLYAEYVQRFNVTPRND